MVVTRVPAGVGDAVPTVVTSHFFIDLPTLFAVTVFVSATGGLLLLLAWMQNRSTPALALWGIGYLFGAAAAALLAMPGFIPNSWSVCAGNALLCGAYGMMWGGARSFEGRRIHIPLLAAGAAIWVAAFQFEGFAASLQARVSLVSAISRDLCAARRLRALVCPRPRTDLALADIGAGARACRLSAGAHPVRVRADVFGCQRSAARASST